MTVVLRSRHQFWKKAKLERGFPRNSREKWREKGITWDEEFLSFSRKSLFESGPGGMTPSHNQNLIKGLTNPGLFKPRVGDCDWFISEYGGEDLFFGYAIICNPEFAEWGNISFTELKQIRIPPGIEADCGFFDPSLKHQRSRRLEVSKRPMKTRRLPQTIRPDRFKNRIETLLAIEKLNVYSRY